jgi:N-formylglutamate deformylase
MSPLTEHNTERRPGPAIDPLNPDSWSIEVGDGPVVATAIHSGHEVRPDIERWLAVSDEDRLREEDPLTGLWTTVGDSSVRVFRSRFEVDLNRPREKAIPASAEDTWGLDVWREPPPREVVTRSLDEYDRFYASIEDLLERLIRDWNSVLVLDLHSYNHRRGGPESPGDSFLKNPEVNVGTGTMKRGRWATLVDRFIDSLRSQPFANRRLDVRENVRFRGGYFPEWLHTRYPEKVCVLALEFKKVFMDEWSGTANIAALEELRVALRNAASAVRPELARIR